MCELFPSNFAKTVRCSPVTSTGDLSPATPLLPRSAHLGPHQRGHDREEPEHEEDAPHRRDDVGRGRVVEVQADVVVPLDGGREPPRLPVLLWFFYFCPPNYLNNVITRFFVPVPTWLPAQCGFACFFAVFLTPFCDGSEGQWRAWCFLVEFRREKRFFRATCKTDKLP